LAWHTKKFIAPSAVALDRRCPPSFGFLAHPCRPTTNDVQTNWNLGLQKTARPTEWLWRSDSVLL